MSLELQKETLHSFGTLSLFVRDSDVRSEAFSSASIMGGGNGMKSAMARDRKNAKADGAGKVTTSEDRKKHEEAKNAHQCTICLSGFPRTVKQPELQQHLDNKHAKAGKTLAEAFPTFTASE